MTGQSDPKRRPMKILAPITTRNGVMWIRVGSAFPKEDGTFNLYLDALPATATHLTIKPCGDGKEG